MVNKELVIANLDTASFKVQLQSADGKETSPIAVGPKSFVEINSFNGKLPWNLGFNKIPPQPSDTIQNLPAIVSVVLNTLTAILYPSTAPK